MHRVESIPEVGLDFPQMAFIVNEQTQITIMKLQTKSIPFYSPPDYTTLICRPTAKALKS